MGRAAGRRAAGALGAIAWFLIAATAVPSRGEAQGLPSSLAAFLREPIGLPANELETVSGGAPVVKALETADQREIAVFGIVRIDVPRAFYVRLVTAFPSSLRAPSRHAFALFADPATAADVANVTLPHDDVQDLARCRAGACKVKLSAEAIAHLRTTVDFGSRSADSAVNAHFRDRMVAFVTGYRSRGDSALLVYGDQSSSTAAAQVFQEMLSRSPYMYRYAPSLERYLERYPRDRPANVAEALFWSEDDLSGLKPTITITHEVVYAPPELPGITLIAEKLLYAAHYLDGALTLSAVVDQPEGPPGSPAGIYLVLLRRLHFDDLPSGGPINLRARVIRELGNRTMTFLRDARARSEQAYARGTDSR